MKRANIMAAMALAEASSRKGPTRPQEEEMSKDDAAVHVAAAIQALSLDGAWRVDIDTGEETPIPPIQINIAEELERIDSALGPKGESMFFRLALKVREAMIELHAALAALES